MFVWILQPPEVSQFCQADYFDDLGDGYHEMFIFGFSLCALGFASSSVWICSIVYSLWETPLENRSHCPSYHMRFFHFAAWSTGLWHALIWMAGYLHHSASLFAFASCQDAFIGAMAILFGLSLVVHMKIRKRQFKAPAPQTFVDRESRVRMFAGVYIMCNTALCGSYIIGIFMTLPSVNAMGFFFGLSFSQGLFDALVCTGGETLRRWCLSCVSWMFSWLPDDQHEDSAAASWASELLATRTSSSLSVRHCHCVVIMSLSLRH
jgi:hypothetical protein